MSEALPRPGRAEEAALLSDLALRSKGHWGYDAAFLEACRGELTLTHEMAAGAVVAVVGDVVVGFHLLEPADPDERGDADESADRASRGRLEMLFVDPDTIGAGVGRLLYDDAVQCARSRGWRSLVLDADPGAESFYLWMGARRIGEVPSDSIPGRVLPVLEIDVVQ